MQKRNGTKSHIKDYNQKAFGIVDPKELEVWTK